MVNDLAQKNSTDFDSSAIDSSRLDASFSFDGQSVQTTGEKYVVFCLGANFFAVASSKVAEVVQLPRITPLPNVPEWLLGIADLRGAIISVISLQKLLGAPESPLQSKTKFVVLKSQNLSSSAALAVDGLGEVVVLQSEEIQASENEKTSFLFGRATYKTNVLNLLDAENLLASLTI